MTGASVDIRGFGYHPPGRVKPALAGIDLSIPAGQRVLLLGESGSGKSTLLRAIAGLLDAGGKTSGSVLVDEAPVAHANSQVGLLLQDPDAQLVLSRAGEDVAFGPQNRGLAPCAVERRVADALDAVGFPYAPSRSVQALSGGERQRLALAGVLALGPDVLLLDEPTSMLDPSGAELVRRAVADVAASTGVTVVVVEHRVQNWLSMVDRAVIISPTGVVADGSPEQVRTSSAAATTWLAADTARAAVPVDPGVPLVHAKDVGYRHRGADGDALADVSTTLATGSALQVSGPNGSGKTTLARLLGGLVRPTRGEVRASKSLVGARLRDSRPDRWRAGDLAGRIGSVFQNPEHMFLTGNVRSELALGPRSLGVAPDETTTLVDELMERLNLSQLADQNPFTLSGGEQRRLSVAAVLATTPRVLILDEPTFGQDPVTWRELCSLLIARKRQGVGLAVMTHDQEFGDAVCDRSLSLSAPPVRGA